VHPLDEAEKLLPEFRRLANEAPDELTTWAVMRKAPPLPFLPAEWHGKEVLIFAACYSGDMAEGEKATRGLRALGTPIADVISPHPFVGWQTAFDPLLAPGARNYWKSNDFADLADGAIDAMLGAVRALPSPECEVFIAHVGGAMARVQPDATRRCQTHVGSSVCDIAGPGSSGDHAMSARHSPSAADRLCL
jgi:hypothetical protein